MYPCAILLFPPISFQPSNTSLISFALSALYCPYILPLTINIQWAFSIRSGGSNQRDTSDEFQLARVHCRLWIGSALLYSRNAVELHSPHCELGYPTLFHWIHYGRAHDSAIVLELRGNNSVRVKQPLVFSVASNSIRRLCSTACRLIDSFAQPTLGAAGSRKIHGKIV